MPTCDFCTNKRREVGNRGKRQGAATGGGRAGGRGSSEERRQAGGGASTVCEDTPKAFVTAEEANHAVGSNGHHVLCLAGLVIEEGSAQAGNQFSSHLGACRSRRVGGAALKRCLVRLGSNCARLRPPRPPRPCHDAFLYCLVTLQADKVLLSLSAVCSLPPPPRPAHAAARPSPTAAGRHTMAATFAVGDPCEVAGAAADGFAAAWFRGRVESTRRPADRAAVSDELAIAFPDFVRPDGKSEVEHHAARSHRVRPAQPAPAVTPLLAEYQARAGGGWGAGWRLGLCGRVAAGCSGAAVAITLWQRDFVQ